MHLTSRQDRSPIVACYWCARIVALRGATLCSTKWINRRTNDGLRHLLTVLRRSDDKIACVGASSHWTYPRGYPYATPGVAPTHVSNPARSMEHDNDDVRKLANDKKTTTQRRSSGIHALASSSDSPRLKALHRVSFLFNFATRPKLST